jgi:hypothetical protein
MLPLEPSTGNIPLRCFSKLLWEFAVNGGRGYFPNLSLLLQCIRIAAGFGQTVFLRSCTGKSRLSQHFKKFWLFSAHNPSRSLCVVLQFSVLALFSLFSSVYWWISNPSTAPDDTCSAVHQPPAHLVFGPRLQFFPESQSGLRGKNMTFSLCHLLFCALQFQMAVRGMYSQSF